jgi:hypothetical protein
MKIEQVYEEIKRLDNSEFIEKLNYQGINLWPLLRYHILLKFKDEEGYLNSPSSHKLNNISWWEKLKLKRHIISNRKKFENNSSEILFWDEVRFNTDQINGEIYNKHIQPYLELVNEFSNATLFSVDDKLKHKKNILYLNPWFFILSQPDSISFDKDVLLKYKVVINYNAFNHHAIMMIKWKNYFLNLFRNRRPKLIFMACFYDPMNFGLISACHEYGIKTIDIQHGKQGKYHPIYYGWNYFTKNGYTLLPNYFWVWGEYFQKILEEGAMNERFPNVVRGGNAWLMKEKKSNFDLKRVPQKYLNPNTKTFLIALQPVETDYTINFIRKLAEYAPELNIVLRFHPVMQKDKLTYESELNKYLNVDFEIGNDLKLIELFSFCHYIASPWSTVLLEGLEFGLNSIVIHPNGKSIFKEDIESGLLIYFDDPIKMFEYSKLNERNVDGVINIKKDSIMHALNLICK